MGVCVIRHMSYRKYAKPRPIRRLVDDVLTDDDFCKFLSTEKLVLSARRNRSVDGVLTGVDVVFEEQLNELLEKASRLAKDELWDPMLAGAGKLMVFGWPQGSPSQEPEQLGLDVLRDSDLLLRENQIRTPDSILYQSCVVVDKESVSRESGIWMVNDKKPLFWWHESPPPSWYREASNPSSSKREEKKAETQAMYRGWREECQRLRQDNPEKSDIWIARKIAGNKELNPKGSSEGTVRKNMK